ncbi:sensor domain-containing diguanylate cyclase [Cupriavidus sp. UME77]|uniref:sensor domain-containing diguanylate cyclase n=1 Tax=Cupriavidus sp. UME77 TaxID=1862321 RepID=UPI0016027B58|nr:sensor domain-containing diguanylate cyclase [Cupriavidus sp. UME77]
MRLATEYDRPASRLLPAEIDASGQHAEPSVIDWLLHDDQVIRECFRHAAAILKNATGAAMTAVTLLDEEHQHYRAAVGMPLSPISRKHSLCDHVVRHGDLFVLEDALADPRFGECMLVRCFPFVRFYAAIPIKGPCGTVVGALCAMDSAPHRITLAQCEVFRHLRAMVENDLKLRTATAIDPLTQLFNRRAMLESVRRRWHETADGEEIGAVMVDVDWFKRYNDAYGHPAGDTCLREVASVLQSIADAHRMLAGRLGGEEFGLLLCGAPRPALETALEDLRLSVERLKIEHRGSPFGSVTLSIGASLARKKGAVEPGSREGFALADRALYMAKADGRNKVVII